MNENINCIKTCSLPAHIEEQYNNIIICDMRECDEHENYYYPIRSTACVYDVNELIDTLDAHNIKYELINYF